MNKAEILEVIQRLAMSKGAYGRLYEQIKDNEEYLTMLEEQGFADATDLVMFFEV